MHGLLSPWNHSISLLQLFWNISVIYPSVCVSVPVCVCVCFTHSGIKWIDPSICKLMSFILSGISFWNSYYLNVGLPRLLLKFSCFVFFFFFPIFYLSFLPNSSGIFLKCIFQLFSLISAFIFNFQEPILVFWMFLPQWSTVVSWMQYIVLLPKIN